MATYTRNNAWNNGGTFDNLDLLWYAKGVGLMQSLALDNPNSWWFFAAIHGENTTDSTQPSFWGGIPDTPQVPTAPLPSQDLQALYWNQCQHQSWYFLPWHRGYLIALEAQIRQAVVSLGGPADWALPYWDYVTSGQNKIPPAFTVQTLPDGTPNPLYVTARYGPYNNGDIYVIVTKGDPNFPRPVTDACESNTVYTGSNKVTPAPGFGGPSTGFNHGEGTNGNLESNPHNLVHVEVGGSSPDNEHEGLMSDPDIAGLDPIFYLHHANIDRLWAAWNANGKKNPTDSNWLNGPPATGGQKFAMPMPDGSSWVYTPADVNSLDQLDYIYDSLAISVLPQSATSLAQRLDRLGAVPAAASTAQGETMDSGEDAELLGTHDGALKITSSGALATVRLDSEVRGRVSASLANASETNVPDHVYLKLENVRGTRDSYLLNVSVNQQIVESVALFGLRNASLKDGQHGGAGLTYVLDITNIIDNLFLDHALDADSLDVSIVPHRAVPESEELTVGRVSVYRQGHQ